ncbi:MAG: HAMP domain-containing histidine kinase [Alphaproteobacteria bacterium]|nr:MAG: HAMP domain-containing histidine kinase [Alphaproteobacteria bacterium]
MFKSFSFRAGAAFFLLIMATVVTLKLIAYRQAIVTGEEDTRRIIQAHADEIEQGIERDGVKYAIYLVDALTDQPEDKHLVLAMKSGGILYGNLRAWPEGLQEKSGWHEKSVQLAREPEPVQALLLVKRFHNHQNLIVGYDLTRIVQTRAALVSSLFRDVGISALAALFLTLLLIYVISRHLEKVNAAYRHVMAGDISYRVNAEKDSGDEFAKLARNFNEMMDWVSSLISTLKDSTNSIAHDLRTPLARIRLRLQQMEQHPDLSPEQRGMLQECIIDVDHLTEIFNGILRIAKAEDLSLVRQFEPIDLNVMMRDLAEYYAAYLEGESQGIVLDTPSQPVSVLGEKQLLSQAVANLISNASKYSGGNQDIEITLQRSAKQKGMIEIIVADRGPGVPAEYREKVKERFFRLDESRNTPGIGLGLNLADAVVRLHKGKLMLEDNNPGLKTVVTLPEFQSDKKAA